MNVFEQGVIIIKLNVGDLMTLHPFTVRTDEDAQTVYDLMTEKRIRHVPVHDGRGALVGLISHRDMLENALYAANTLGPSQSRDLLRRMSVAEIMTTKPETTTPDTELERAGKVLLENKFGCLPVMEGNELVGILTESDFVRYFVKGQLAAKAQDASKT